MTNTTRFIPVALCSTLLLVSSCSLPGTSPEESWSGSTTDTDWSTGSGETADTDIGSGATTNSGTATQMQAVSVPAWEQSDVYMTLNGGSGAIMIDSGTGARVNVMISSDAGKTLTATLRTPNDPAGNIRISQIFMPDGSSDGPFGNDLIYALTQSGSYRLVLSANQMAGDPWAGESELKVEIR